jgi:antitoxin CptB
LPEGVEPDEGDQQHQEDDGQTVTMNSHVAEHAELKWRCRRGMLELDILLNTYLDRKYDTLSPQQGAVFSAVLDYPDQVLLDLLLGNMQSNDIEVNRLISAIQQANRS